MGMSIAGLGAAGAAKAPLPLIPPTPDSDPAIWHVASGGRTLGPYSVAQLGLAVSAWELTGETSVWTAGKEARGPIGRVPRIAGLLAAPSSPPAAWTVSSLHSP